MKLTNDFIIMQGFVYEETIEGVDIFYLQNKDDTEYAIAFNPKDNYTHITHLTLTKIGDSRNDNEYITNPLYEDYIHSILEFVSVIVDLEINEKSIILKKELPEKFLEEKYPYDEYTFMNTWEMMFHILHAYEMYENYREFIDHRNKVCTENNWTITPIKLLE